MNLKQLDKEVKKFVAEVGRDECKKYGLSAMMQAFYCGMYLEPCDYSPDEVANDLGISNAEYNYWDDLYYKKSSWFNSGVNASTRMTSRYIKASTGDFNIIYTTEDDLQDLYDDSALTFEGTVIDDDNLGYLVKWLDNYNCHMKKPDFYVTEGQLMNSYYGLTGNNAYPDDCHILSIKLSDLDNVGGIVLPRFQIGGRWFDDIVDNNLRREGR